MTTKPTRNQYIKNCILKPNSIDEFETMLNGNSVSVVMTALLGHLMELELDPAYKKWTKPTIRGTIFTLFLIFSELMLLKMSDPI